MIAADIFCANVTVQYFFRKFFAEIFSKKILQKNSPIATCYCNWGKIFKNFLEKTEIGQHKNAQRNAVIPERNEVVFLDVAH